MKFFEFFFTSQASDISIKFQFHMFRYFIHESRIRQAK